MQTETLDKLYLEISQFTRAKTAREIQMEERILKLELEAVALRAALRSTLELATKWEPDSSSQDDRRALFDARRVSVGD